MAGADLVWIGRGWPRAERRLSAAGREMRRFAPEFCTNAAINDAAQAVWREKLEFYM
jgi:hypothetical protein